jgi:hypothetical protein
MTDTSLSTELAEIITPPPPKKRKKSKMRVGAENGLIRWLMNHAKDEPRTTAEIRKGMGYDAGGHLFNLQNLGVVERVAWATYQISPEFRDVPPPPTTMRYTKHWVAEVRANPIVESNGHPSILHELSDEDLLAVLEVLTDGTLPVTKFALVSEWMELTRRIVS